MHQDLAKPATPPASAQAKGATRQQHLYEVWGDTVEGRDLALSIIIGAVVSLSAYGAAQLLIGGLVESAQMARAYSMLVGILGCLAGGAISAAFFKPKRNVVEHVAEPGFREQVVADLLKEYGTLGRLEDLSPEVVQELRELELYELFREAQAREESERATSASPEPELPGKVVLSGGRV